ncbi:MAG: 1-acyl-sn-glycerol-3-phosphate acyltransferase [Pseudomonadota bacterium]
MPDGVEGGAARGDAVRGDAVLGGGARGDGASALGSALSWDAAAPPALAPTSRAQTAIAWTRVALAAVLTGALLIFYLLFRAIEKVWPAFRWREGVQRLWARGVGRIAGLTVTRVGEPMREGGALVSNHVSWSDIFVLVGQARMTFVSKAEVRGWPGVGLIAGLCDTVFIERRRSAAKAQTEEMARRVRRGERLVFFPEGTSTDGLRALEFRSTLFAPFMEEGMRDEMWIQPVSVVYHAPPGQPRAFYGWWGTMSFGGHVMDVLKRSFGGRAEVVFHPPVRPRDFKDRKALARHCGEAVARGLRERLGAPEDAAEG